MPEILGVILAGGLSSRMGGGDKSLLELGGRPLLSHVLERLKPQIPRIGLNANGDEARFAEFGLPVFGDSVTGFAGPLAGVLAGMDWAAALGVGQIVTVAADTPFFPRDLVSRLEEAAQSEHTPLAMAVTPDPKRGTARHPTFGLWSVDLRNELRAAINAGVRKVVEWTNPVGCAQCMFHASPFDPFFNVNTPEDLIVAGQMIGKFRL